MSRSKLSVLLASGVALAAFAGMSSSAQAIVFPDCEQYNNEFGIQEFNIQTNNDVAYAPSGSSGISLACGAEPNPQTYFCDRNEETLYENSVLTYPKGTRFTDTSRVAKGSYAGSSLTSFIGILYCRGDVDLIDPSTSDATTITAYPPGEESAKPFCDNDENGEVVACYLADAPGTGSGWQAVRKTRIDGEMRFQLWIYPFKSHPGDYAIAKIEWELCDYYGKRGPAEKCGTKEAGNLPTAYNGATTVPSCSNGNGVFEIYVTNRKGNISDTVTDCAVWTIGPQPTDKFARKSIAFAK